MSRAAPAPTATAQSFAASCWDKTLQEAHDLFGLPSPDPRTPRYMIVRLGDGPGTDHDLSLENMACPHTGPLRTFSCCTSSLTPPNSGAGGSVLNLFGRWSPPIETINLTTYNPRRQIRIRSKPHRKDCICVLSQSIIKGSPLLRSYPNHAPPEAEASPSNEYLGLQGFEVSIADGRGYESRMQTSIAKLKYRADEQYRVT